MNVVVVFLLVGLACAAGIARAAEPFQTFAQPGHAAGEVALPVAPYAGVAAADSAGRSLERAGSGHHPGAHARALGGPSRLPREVGRPAQLPDRRPRQPRRHVRDGAEGDPGSAGIRQSDYPLEACIYANTPPLVRITRQGEQARECDAQ